MSVLVVLLTFTTAVLSSPSAKKGHSTFIQTEEGYYLTGHVIDRQKASSALSCAHLCLRSRPLCRSVNYREIEGNMICELNDDGTDSAKANAPSLVPMPGYVFGQMLDLTGQKMNESFGEPANSGKTFVFSTLGARGETGPTNTLGYVGTPLEGHVTVSDGIQIWSVPETGSYVIEVFGASGANGTYVEDKSSWRTGGLGARMTGTFQLQKGTQLKILVGQEGNRTTDPYLRERPGGGGGGSFVTFPDDTPLIIAGGGGGGGIPREQFKNGDPGQSTENGGRCGGAGGYGGNLCNADTGMVDLQIPGGGGAGLLGNGGGKRGFSVRFIHGGTGGKCPVSQGGFGGGGYALKAGGGGGGYSGGGVLSGPNIRVAGGGGSYNSGKNQQNMAGANKGDGKVIITLQN